MKHVLMFGAIAAAATLATAADVHPDVIFGGGNANGGYTVNTASNVEVGLRAKVRYNASGLPENTFNYDGVDTYTFDPTQGNAPGNRAVWNFEWSVNTDVSGVGGADLGDFTYQIALFKVNADGTNIADAVAFDMINGANPGEADGHWDHSIGDNSTGNGAGVEAGDIATYNALIGSMSVAQNSWNYDFFDGAGALAGWDPNQAGDYIIRLSVLDGMGAEVVTTDITVHVVPLPAAAFAGMGLLGLLGGARVIRRR